MQRQVEVSTSFTECPNCHRDMLAYASTSHYVFFGGECRECGYAHTQAILNRDTNIEDDLGNCVFTCIYDPYGSVKLTYNDGYIDYLPIDRKFSNKFLEDMKGYSKRGLITSAILSYLDNGKIKKTELLDLL